MCLGTLGGIVVFVQQYSRQSKTRQDESSGGPVNATAESGADVGVGEPAPEAREPTDIGTNGKNCLITPLAKCQNQKQKQE